MLRRGCVGFVQDCEVYSRNSGSSSSFAASTCSRNGEEESFIFRLFHSKIIRIKWRSTPLAGVGVSYTLFFVENSVKFSWFDISDSALRIGKVFSFASCVEAGRADKMSVMKGTRRVFSTHLWQSICACLHRRRLHNSQFAKRINDWRLLFADSLALVFLFLCLSLSLAPLLVALAWIGFNNIFYWFSCEPNVKLMHSTAKGKF